LGPRDVLGEAPVGALDWDLRAACLRALFIPPGACRSFALDMSWARSAELFLAHIGAREGVPLAQQHGAPNHAKVELCLGG
jgi:hypothetical protein